MSRTAGAGRLRLPRSTAALGLVLVLAGCGGGGHDARPTVPRLPRDLAQRLAGEAEAIAASLDAGDACGATQRASALEREVDSAVGGGHLPVALRARLSGGVRDLLDRMPPCRPAAAPASTGPPPWAHGHGKGKGHEKRKKHRKEGGDGG